MEDVSFKILGKQFQADLNKGAFKRGIIQTINFMKKQALARN